MSAESSSGSLPREAEIDTETNNVKHNEIVTPDARPDDSNGLETSDIDSPPVDPTFSATPMAVLSVCRTGSSGSLDTYFVEDLTSISKLDKSTTLESRNVDSNEPLTLESSSTYDELNTEALPDG